MSKHTPGPWKWNKGDSDNNIVGANGKTILWGIWYNTSEAGAEVAKDEDARLIAAAPELLEACRVAKRALELEYGKGCCPEIDAAIAKAEGAQ